MSDELREALGFELQNNVLVAYRGSVAHGMYVPPEQENAIDDIDLIAVVIAPIEYYLGLAAWGSRGTKEFKSGRWDVVYYEIKKFVSLLLQGNPNVLATLWLSPEYFLQLDEAGRRLIENRHLFRGKHVYNAFAGYAHQQLIRMESREPAELRKYLALDAELKRRGIHPNHKGERFDTVPGDTGEENDAAAHGNEALLQAWRSYHNKGENLGYMGEKRKRLVLDLGYDAKNAAHLIRLLRMAKEFLETGDMQVFRSDAAELLEIKRGAWPLERVKAHAEDLFAAVKTASDSSPLPEGPNRQGAETLLVRILRERLSI